MLASSALRDLELGPGRLEVTGHAVDRPAELADLVGAVDARAGVEVAAADPLGGAGHARDRRQDDAPQEHEHARGDPEDGEAGDQQLAVPGPGHLLVERLPRETDAHDPAHRRGSARGIAGTARALRSGWKMVRTRVASSGSVSSCGVRGLDRAAEEGMVQALARLPAERVSAGRAGRGRAPRRR